jgi:hypothetical protein
MMAVAGSDSDFSLARDQIELLAGVQVCTKSVERHVEQIGAEIRRIEQAEITRSVQLQLPIPMGTPIPILYVEIDGTGIPVVKKETQGRTGKVEGKPARTREVKLGCVFTSAGVDGVTGHDLCPFSGQRSCPVTLRTEDNQQGRRRSPRVTHLCSVKVTHSKNRIRGRCSP